MKKPLKNYLHNNVIIVIIFSNISKFKGHVKCCSDILSIIYKFEDKNVVIFQDNFSYLGDLSFDVYFDYVSTTGDSVFNNKKWL